MELSRPTIKVKRRRIWLGQHSGNMGQTSRTCVESDEGLWYLLDSYSVGLDNNKGASQVAHEYFW